MFKNLKQGDYYMENIKKLVEKLEEEFDEKKQIEILQDIGAMLINNYVIKVGDLTIEPMLVEAYYYHKGKFEDESVCFFLLHQFRNDCHSGGCRRNWEMFILGM